MQTVMINEPKNTKATVNFVFTDKTGITGNILFRVKIGNEERIIGHDKKVCVGMFYDIVKRLERSGFVELPNQLSERCDQLRPRM